MQALTIKDLSIAEQLDSGAMRAVRGGTFVGYAPTSYFNYSPSYKSDSSKFVMGNQSNTTNMLIENQTGNNVAFAANINTTILPVVNSSNNISVA